MTESSLKNDDDKVIKGFRNVNHLLNYGPKERQSKTVATPKLRLRHQNLKFQKMSLKVNLTSKI